ncbi:sugar phosphate isomerase [Actibacterium mucosum KCTC 23349]|uniref:Sugar phosphate isomerase n=1 Tax=Actibacterium mucosum KCTC 23349 TaxID=1454373 RepID=A0A037ZK84_9RHOB|nr:sugar phosphate isomerase/epimerase family protein [Actibacterium mucosum]KAJ55246.1 sugar phosphate isomerase [Actibacterium mucosum KCTC 23349]
MSVPVIGAALALEDLRIYRDWIVEKQRDLELQSFVDAKVLMSDWADLAAAHKELLDGYTGRLGIHGPFWGFTLHSIDPEIRDVVRRRVAQGLDVCEALGATSMVLHSPYTTWDYNNIDNYANGRSSVIGNTHDTLAAAVKRAEDMGVTLVLENIEDINPADRRILAESFDSVAVKLSVDTGHAHYAHGSTGAPPVDYYIRHAGEMLGHVHLQDADGYADRHWALGQGTIRWHAVFAAIKATGADPRLILELRDKAGLPASMEYLAREGLGQ